MRRALTWLAGLAGIAALLRRRSRQRVTAPRGASSGTATDVADPVVELRQKLEETRTSARAPSPETETPSSVDERRARVHERAQEAINLMHGSDDDPAAGEDDTA